MEGELRKMPLYYFPQAGLLMEINVGKRRIWKLVYEYSKTHEVNGVLKFSKRKWLSFLKKKGVKARILNEPIDIYI